MYFLSMLNRSHLICLTQSSIRVNFDSWNSETRHFPVSLRGLNLCLGGNDSVYLPVFVNSNCRMQEHRIMAGSEYKDTEKEKEKIKSAGESLLVGFVIPCWRKFLYRKAATIIILCSQLLVKKETIMMTRNTHILQEQRKRALQAISSQYTNFESGAK